MENRDGSRDAERDEDRDAKRDKDRDAKRDKDRDAKRDKDRDAERDEDRDAERDEDRDAEHDENRNAERDAEFDDASGGPWNDAPFLGRDEIRDHERDDARDRDRDQDRDAERDETRDSQRDAARDRRRDQAVGAVPSSFKRDDVPLIVAVAKHCRDLIKAWDQPVLDQPASLQLKHLEWMCNQVAEQSDAWPTTKLHRWIGFIQAGMIANRVVRLEGARRMFDEASKAHPSLDEDLLDHLSPDDPFDSDIGASD